MNELELQVVEARGGINKQVMRPPINYFTKNTLRTTTLQKLLTPHASPALATLITCRATPPYPRKLTIFKGELTDKTENFPDSLCRQLVEARGGINTVQRLSSTNRLWGHQTTTLQKCAAVPIRVRVSGSQTFVSLNSRLESNKEEERDITGYESINTQTPRQPPRATLQRNEGLQRSVKGFQRNEGPVCPRLMYVARQRLRNGRHSPLTRHPGGCVGRVHMPMQGNGSNVIPRRARPTLELHIITCVLMGWGGAGGVEDKGWVPGVGHFYMSAVPLWSCLGLFA